MPIIEAILYYCEECKTVSLQGGVCANCEQPLQMESFVPKAAEQRVHRTACPHTNTARVTGLGLHCVDCGEDL